MTDNLDRIYWAARESEQRAAARHAVDPDIAVLHRRLADRHAQAAWSADAIERPEHESDVQDRRRLAPGSVG